MTTQPMTQQVIDLIVGSVLSRYRIDRAKATTIVRDTVMQDADLTRTIEERSGVDAIRRSRAFKRVAKSAKRRVYHHLRVYTADTAEFAELVRQMEALPVGTPAAHAAGLCQSLAQRHASTRERLQDLGEFHRQLFSHVAGASSILDVGCGVYPLLFPFAGQGRGIECYMAVDSDADAVRAVRTFSHLLPRSPLCAALWDIGEGWQPVTSAAGRERFDVALLLKLVPVVARQEPELARVLAAVPADVLVVTGSVHALTKHQNIARRERDVLKRFVEAAGRRVVGEISLCEEFGYVLREEV